LFSLLWLGGISIWGFALTLTFGVIIGTYSSVFVASPVLLEMTGEKLGRAK
jgi:preprotein translocase subunit SecF